MLDTKCKAYRDASEAANNITSYWAERGFRVDAWVEGGRDEEDRPLYQIKSDLVNGAPTRRRKPKAAKPSGPPTPKPKETIQQYEARMGHKGRLPKMASGLPGGNNAAQKKYEAARELILSKMPDDKFICAAQIAKMLGTYTSSVSNHLFSLKRMGRVERVQKDGQRAVHWRKVAIDG